VFAAIQQGHILHHS